MKRQLRLRDLMRPLSRLKYLAWRVASLGSAITVRLYSGERLILRCSPATDISVAYEVFVMEIYRPPTKLDPATVRSIVDLGANVGYIGRTQSLIPADYKILNGLLRIAVGSAAIVNCAHALAQLVVRPPQARISPMPSTAIPAEPGTA
jgi:hypothetical protein